MSPGRGPKVSRFKTCKARSCSLSNAAEPCVLFGLEVLPSPACAASENKATKAITIKARPIREGENAEHMLRILTPFADKSCHGWTKLPADFQKKLGRRSTQIDADGFGVRGWPRKGERKIILRAVGGGGWGLLSNL